MIVTCAALTAEQTTKLTALANYGTRYEAAIVRADGSKVLLGYLGRHSFSGLAAAVDKNALRVVDTLQDAGAQVRSDKATKRLVFTTDAGSPLGHAEFTGRTERDAIREGELSR